MHNLLTSVGTRDNINDLVTPLLDTQSSKVDYLLPVALLDFTECQVQCW